MGLGNYRDAGTTDDGPARSRAYFEQRPEAVHAVSQHGYTPLGWAAWQGDVETVTLLLNLGADLTPKAAVLLGMGSVVSGLLAADPAPAASRRVAGRNYPLLWFAAISGDLEIAALSSSATAQM